MPDITGDTTCRDYFVFKLGTFIKYSLLFNFAKLNWPKEQSISARYLWLKLAKNNRRVLTKDMINHSELPF